MHMEHRVLLSGTPLQNNVTELFSLLNFLEPTQFASQETFLQDFGKLESEDQVKKLQALLKPMMLRRMKEDVEKSLAPKEETIIEVCDGNAQSYCCKLCFLIFGSCFIAKLKCFSYFVGKYTEKDF